MVTINGLEAEQLSQLKTDYLQNHNEIVRTNFRGETLTFCSVDVVESHETGEDGPQCLVQILNELLEYFSFLDHYIPSNVGFLVIHL